MRCYCNDVIANLQQCKHELALHSLFVIDHWSLRWHLRSQVSKSDYIGSYVNPVTSNMFLQKSGIDDDHYLNHPLIKTMIKILVESYFLMFMVRLLG